MIAHRAPVHRDPGLRLLLGCACLALLLFAARAAPAGEEEPFPDFPEEAPALADAELWARLDAADWIADGPADAPRTVYVFTDPDCPWCQRFWRESRPWVVAGRVQLRHLVVAILGADSTPRAAAILGADDPAEALRRRALSQGRGGPPPTVPVPAAVAATLEHNRELMRLLGVHAVPASIARDADGVLHRWPGLPAAADLPELLGPLEPPRAR